MTSSAELRRAGIDLDAVTQRLEDDGVRKFSESYERLRRARSPTAARQ